MASVNHVKHVAIVGAGGSVGKHITEAILSQGKHILTALTRPQSTTPLPAGLHAVHKAAYDDHDALVAALKGQDVLIITLSVMASPDTQKSLIDAAVAAGVPWIMPNEWGGRALPEGSTVAEDTIIGTQRLKTRAYIERVSLEKNSGRTKWIGLRNGFWYEYSLSRSSAMFGFDLKSKSLELVDGGAVPIRTSTWPMCGLAVAKIFALPVHADSTGQLCLDQLANSSVSIASFNLTQKDMLASVLRVTGEAESDWKITHEGARERFDRGKAMLGRGDRNGFAILLYSRYMYPEFKHADNNDVMNDRLGLPKEDLDEFTKIALQL